jgi:glycosyltransferase involved in cell wall biosynthesis
VRRKYGLPAQFVLYVGTIEPRKNLNRLLQAFELLRRDGFNSLVLVLVGSRGWDDAAVIRGAERLAACGAVRLLGRASAQDLVALYNLADVLAFPSLYEGFGLPVIEAMACGTPVVSSPNGSLAEIVGNAAELVDPTQVESIALGLRRVLSDPERRAALRTAGIAQAARFSWEAAAAQTRQIYASVARTA